MAITDDERKNNAHLTATHYTKQWGSDLNFQGFVEQNPEAAMVMPGRQLGWSDLFQEIRAKSESRRVSVFDAACGFGDVARRLLDDPAPNHLQYCGADIHNALSEIVAPISAKFLQWDITKKLPSGEIFDYIICRAALHHTPKPSETYEVLASQLAKGGTLAVSVYAKKAPMREAIDDAFREKIVQESNDEALKIARQFTLLGRDLQASNGTITIEADLPYLGIQAGTYPVQSFIYDYFIKCWHNSQFSTEHCDLVNFDWYHPPYAYRFDAEELKQMALTNGLTIRRCVSIKAQHYLEAVRPDA